MVHCKANAKYIELSTPNGQSVQKNVQKDALYEKAEIDLDIGRYNDIITKRVTDRVTVKVTVKERTK